MYKRQADKYQSSYERCAKVIDRWSSQKGLDMTEFFIRVVFSFLVGNSDMHLRKEKTCLLYTSTHKYAIRTRDAITFLRRRDTCPDAFCVTIRSGKAKPFVHPFIDHTQRVMQRYQRLLEELARPYPDLMTVRWRTCGWPARYSDKESPRCPDSTWRHAC